MAKTTKLMLFYAFIIAIIVFYIFQYVNPIQLKDGIYVNPPQTIMPFELTDHRGHAFTEAELSGHWSLLFFGFSACPVICPGMLETLKHVEQHLPDSKKVQVIFVSVDPAHDSVKQLNEYMSRFNKNFTALTGPMPAINALQKQLHVPVSNAPSTHGMEMILINPHAQVQAYFQFPMSSKALLEDLNKVILPPI